MSEFKAKFPPAHLFQPAASDISRDKQPELQVSSSSGFQAVLPDYRLRMSIYPEPLLRTEAVVSAFMFTWSAAADALPLNPVFRQTPSELSTGSHQLL